ncbi:MAG: response regulator, partial [Ilumatobacteraceae bacterium]
DILDMVSFILTHAGYTVVSVSDGSAAIASIESNPPELAILDVMMPGMSGIEVLRRVRKNESVKDLTVILLTVLSSDSDVAAGIAAGANDYVTKPAVLSELLQTVQSSLEKRNKPAVGDSKYAPPPK